MSGLQQLIERDKDVLFRPLDQVKREDIKAVEGTKIAGAENIFLHTLFATPEVIVLHSIRKKGYADPPHQHNDHETINYLASGKMRVHIGDNTFDAVTGASWKHGKGVRHWSEALEDCVVLEIKTPPVKTW